MIRLLLLGLGVALAGAQDEASTKPAALINSGKPMRVPYACSTEDMQWAGMSCSEREPCPIYLEITDVEVTGNKIFLTGNLHNGVTTLYSILLGSSDAGKSWTEPFERIRGAGLDQIQFYDFESGWISGQNLHPLPQDPFLLITGDGGQTWRKQPVFGDSRHGSILQFGFTSKTAGHLVVDRGQASESSRYERYETPNGGDTWMIREASDSPIRIRSAGSANPDWRIRPDGPSRSFRIERKQGENWMNVAAFLVQIESCKPEDRPMSEPPPIEEAPPDAEPVAPPPALPPRKSPTLKRP
jgi:hypothetical protein